MTKIRRGQGTTPSERHLATLCDKSFLNLWSYPNVHRDQGLRGGRCAGKELCDVLVVFGNHVIVFSEKCIEFPDTGDADLDWKRWYKRAVTRSAKQVLGAERWIATYPDRIFVDPNCTQKLPVPVPSESDRKTHCIVVARGAGSRCKEHFGGGSGSLVINLTQPESISSSQSRHNSLHFCVGDISPSGPYVHVFDDSNLELIMSELDTTSDFVAYLEGKTDFVRSGHLISAAGEEELLAYYLRSIDGAGSREFVSPSGRKTWANDEFLTISEGHWDDLKRHPQYSARQEANRISYYWDGLINHVANHMLAGTSGQIPVKADDQLQQGAVRLMAAESRLARRILSRNITEANHAASRNDLRARVFRITDESDGSKTGYVYLQAPYPVPDCNLTYDEYREHRQAILYRYCMAFRSVQEQLQHIVGIATEPPRFFSADERTEDLLAIDVRDWTDDMQMEGEEFRRKFGIMETGKLDSSRSTEEEWPSAFDEPAVGLRRHSPGPGNRAQRRKQRALARRRRRK